MNYWPRWISAIKKRTAGLSLAEMGAYDRLLDHYYAEEAPLPADLDECCRLAVAMTKDERKAVERVLSKFFTLTPEGYRNQRADEEIALALPKIAAAKTNGAKGGRPRGTRQKPSGFPPGTQQQPTAKAPHPHPQLGDTEDYPHRGGGEQAEVITAGFQPTQAGALCRELRLVGIQDVNPGHPRLLALLEAGAAPQEFTGFAKTAVEAGRGFAWVLGAVEGERRRAAAMAGQLHRGPMPNRQEAQEQRNAAVGDDWLAEQGAA